MRVFLLYTCVYIYIIYIYMYDITYAPIRAPSASSEGVWTPQIKPTPNTFPEEYIQQYMIL